MKTDVWNFSKNYGGQLDYVLGSMTFGSPENRVKTREKLAEYMVNSLVRRGVWKKYKNDPPALAREISVLPVVKIADIVTASETRQEFMDRIAKVFNREKNYLRRYAAAIGAAGPFPWAWRFDTGYPVGQTGPGTETRGKKTNTGAKDMDGFMNSLRDDSQLLYYLLKHASQPVLSGDKFVVSAGKEVVQGIGNLIVQLQKSLRSYFGRSIEVDLVLAPPVVPSIPATAQEGKPPVRSGDANVTEDDLNHIELIMSAMSFTDIPHRDSVRGDLVEYLKEISIPLNHKRSEKGETPVLNIRKSKIFRFALIVKRAKDKNDYKERALKAFKDDPYMHTPGRAVDRVNRGWNFPWNFRFKRRSVLHGHGPATEKKPAACATPALPEVIEIEVVGANVIPMVERQQQKQDTAGRCATCANECDKLTRAVTVIDTLEKKIRTLEMYLLRHVHQSIAGAEGAKPYSIVCVPDDAITKELVKEAANAGQ